MSLVEVAIAVASVSIAFGMGFIALLALGVALWQGFESRRHYRNASRPWLQFDVEFVRDSPTFGVLLRNKGVGPARVTAFTVELDGQKFEANWQDVWLSLFERFGGVASWLPWVESTAFNPNGCHISHGETLAVLVTDGPELTSERIAALQELLGRTIFTVEYQSVYGEKFESNTIGLSVEPLTHL